MSKVPRKKIELIDDDDDEYLAHKYGDSKSIEHLRMQETTSNSESLVRSAVEPQKDELDSRGKNKKDGKSKEEDRKDKKVEKK